MSVNLGDAIFRGLRRRVNCFHSGVLIIMFTFQLPSLGTMVLFCECELPILGTMVLYVYIYELPFCCHLPCVIIYLDCCSDHEFDSSEISF